MIIELRRCRRCKLQFRLPKENKRDSYGFYQSEYIQGFTTTLPSNYELCHMVDTDFAGTEKDFTHYVDILNRLEVGKDLLDFGCSWGYGTWQFTMAGYKADGYDISKERAEYGKRLGLQTYTRLQDIPKKYDVVFSAHVLEHVPNVFQTVRDMIDLTKPGGKVLIFTPNGSAEYRVSHPYNWHTAWGRVHPNFLDECFYKYNYSCQLETCVDGTELLCIL